MAVLDYFAYYFVGANKETFVETNQVVWPGIFP
jgi:hypothetical protein